MVEVYTIEVDVNRVWTLAANDEQFYKSGSVGCHGIARLDEWKPPSFYVYNPLLEDADFVHIGGGCFAFPERLKQKSIIQHLEMAGEFLPIEVENGKGRYYILNVLACINALNESKCTYNKYWDTNENMVKTGSLIKLAFHPTRLAGPSIFKIPQTVRYQVLTSRGVSLDIDEDFIEAYDRERLTGLVFKKIWEE